MPQNNSKTTKIERNSYITSIDENSNIISVIFKKNPYNLKNKNKVIKDTTSLLNDALSFIEKDSRETYRIFVDYSVEDVDYCFPPDSRKIIIQTLMKNKIDKMAITGDVYKKDNGLLIIVKALAIIIPTCKIRYFEDKKEAFIWLKEEKD